MAISLERYTAAHASEWDQFVPTARNSHFMHLRSFMDYHAERFVDQSYMFRYDGELLGVLPANLAENTLHSHQGLTFGGIVASDRLRSSWMLDVFRSLLTALKTEGVVRVIYKKTPYIYERQCADEDLYSLFRTGARLLRRDLGCVVNLLDPLPTASSHNGRKGSNAGVSAGLDYDLTTYHSILSRALERHGVSPVHSLPELERLRAAHPDNIKLFAARRHGEMLAGALVFDTGSVVHTQYLASSEDGRKQGALSVVLNFLKTEFAGIRRYLSFGISTENGGLYLNEGLCRQKEAFGGRAVCHDVYQIDL